jgi:hypothetical protein
MPATRSQAEQPEPHHPGIVELRASPRARLSCLRPASKDAGAKRTRTAGVVFAQEVQTVREFSRSAPPAQSFSDMEEDDDGDDIESLRPMRPVPSREKRAAAKRATRSITRKTRVAGLLEDEQRRASKSHSDELLAHQLAQEEAKALVVIEQELEQLESLIKGMETVEEHALRVRRLHELVNFSVTGERGRPLCISNALLAVFLSNGYESIQDILGQELTMEDCVSMLGTAMTREQEMVLKGMGVKREADMTSEELSVDDE